jgi:hypothetical protein
MISRASFILVWVGFGYASTAAQPAFKSLMRQDALRGQRVDVSGAGMQGAEIDVTFDGKYRSKAIVDSDTACHFVVPERIPLGPHVVRAGVADRLVVPDDGGQLRVKSDPGGKLQLDSISPEVAYPGNGVYELEARGSGLSFSDDEAALLVNGREIGRQPGNSNSGRLPIRIYQAALDRMNIPGGPVRVRIELGDQSSGEAGVTLSTVARGRPTGITARVAAGLAALVVALWWVTQRKPRTERPRFFQWLLLDAETNTLSLSKFQLLLWTSAALLAYVHLFVVQWLVKQHLALPEFPENLSQMLLASAGTAVASQVVTNVRGPKGAGDPLPRVSDLFTTGGVLAIDRLQLFLWTLVGAGGYLATVIFADPATLTEQTKIPASLLPLMGVSAAGYLGGKAARKPGPVIDMVVVTQALANRTLVMSLRGRSLSRNATILIDGDEPSPDSLTLVITTHDDVSSDPTLASDLGVTVISPKAKWISSNPHLLTLTNPDGQKATSPYKI